MAADNRFKALFSNVNEERNSGVRQPLNNEVTEPMNTKTVEVNIVNVNIKVEKELRSHWKQVALDRNTTMSELIREAMKVYLEF